MIKHIHLLFVLLSISSFMGRVWLSQFQPAKLQIKLVKIAPHVIDTVLLLSGLALVFQGNWLAGDMGWVISKFLVLLVYVGLGVLTMRSVGTQRWAAFAGALVCFAYIATVAVSKHGFIS